MNMDIEALLLPITIDSPCGDDVEYDEEFIALEAAAAGKPEQQVGDAVIAAEEPDWADVAQRARTLLARSKDLRVACRLAQALLHREGVPGLHAGLDVIRGYVERYWDSVFPRLDADDDYDPAIRVNAVALLGSLRATVHPLRDTTLLRCPPIGRISARLVAQVSGIEATGAMPERELPHPLEIESALLDCELSSLQAIAESAQGARASIAAIEAEFARRVEDTRSVDLAELCKALAEIHAIVAPVIARRSAERRDAAGADPSIEPSACAPIDEVVSARDHAPIQMLNQIRSRSEVAHALDAICAYLERHEPSSPVPILLERAKRWVGMDFMAVLQDLAPDAAREAERLRGMAST